MQNGNILIIEDDSDIRNSVRILLEKEGYYVNEVSNGKEGISKVKTIKYDLIILDIMLPDMSGIEVCKSIRIFSFVPVLFLTARFSDQDKCEGFDAGGDDYIVKPFSYKELNARVNALIRRNNKYANDTVIGRGGSWTAIGNLRFDSSENSVYSDENRLYLTETEYQILRLLVNNKGNVLSIEEIYKYIWKDLFMESSINTVMVHIKNLRSKMKTAGCNIQIVTVWGKGYSIN